MIRGIIQGTILRLNTARFRAQGMAKTGTTLTINIGMIQFFSLLAVFAVATWWLFVQLGGVNDKIAGSNANLAEKLNTQVSSVIDRLGAVRSDLSKEITDLRERVLLIEATNQKALRSANARTDELARKVAISELERRLALASETPRSVRNVVVGTVTSYDPARKQIAIRDFDGAVHIAEIGASARTIVYGPQGESAYVLGGLGSFEEGNPVAAEYRTTTSGHREVMTIARPTSESLRLPSAPAASPGTSSGTTPGPASPPVRDR